MRSSAMRRRSPQRQVGRGAFRQPTLSVLLVLAALVVFAACSGGDGEVAEAEPLGDVVDVNPGADPEESDGVLETPGSDDADAADEVAAAPSMFDAVDALVATEIPALADALGTSSIPRGEEIRFGGFATETLDGLPFNPGICAGAEARVLGAQARGELDWTLNWLGCTDDGGFADRADNALARTMFRNPVAVVPMISDRFNAERELSDQLTPWIGAGASPAFCGVDHAFGFAVAGAENCPVLSVLGVTTSGPVLRAWLAATGREADGLRVAHVVEGSTTGAERADALRLEAEAAGAQLVVVDDSIPVAAGAGADELDAVARTVVLADPEVVIVELSSATGLHRHLRDAGYNAAIVGVDVEPHLLLENDAASLAGTVQVISGFTAVSDDGFGWSQLEEDAAMLPEPRPPMSLGFVQGYSAVDFFIAGLAAIDGDASGVAFHDLVNSGWRWDGIPGVACASDWPTAHLLPAPCASVVRIDDDGRVDLLLPLTPFDLLVSEATDDG